MVSLQQSDPYRDLLPPLAGAANHTLLSPADHPDAASWILPSTCLRPIRIASFVQRKQNGISEDPGELPKTNSKR